MSDRKLLQLNFRCIDLPNADDHPGLRLGLQSGEDVVQDTGLDQAMPGGVIEFKFDLEGLLDEAEKTVIFYGPAAQGSPKDRFVYLSWGSWSEGIWQRSSRMKVPLSVFPFDVVQLADSHNQALSLQIQVSNQNGGPAAASLKPEALQVL